MTPLTPSQRKAKQRRNQADWLKRHARGLTAEGLVTQLMRGNACLVWSKPMQKKGKQS